MAESPWHRRPTEADLVAHGATPPVTLLRTRLVRLAIVLIGLLLIGLAVLHLPPIRARVLERVRGYARQELGIVVRASSLHYSLLRRSIELRDVSLTAESSGDPFLEADRVVLVAGPGLFRGRVAVER